MNLKPKPSAIKSRTVHYAAFCLALALPHAHRAHAQCHTDPVTGQRVCALPPESPSGGRAPALDSFSVAPNTSAHCRVAVADGSLGSGTLIAVDSSCGFILTCAHLFDRSTAGIVVTFADGSRFAARLVGIDRAHDLAALAIRRPHLPPLTVSQEEPSGTLAACGFGADGQFRRSHGAIVGQALAVGATHPCLTIAGAVRPGDSGGGVLNTRGQLVGVVWGQRDQRTYATCGRPVREFLARILGQHPRPAQSSPVPTAPQPDWQAWSRDIESRIAALNATKQDKGHYLQAGDLHGYLKIEDVPKFDATPFARRAELEPRLNSFATRFESMQAQVEGVRRQLEKLAAERAGVFQGLSLGKLVAGTLGLSGPPALALMLAGRLAARRWRRRFAGPRGNSTATCREATQEASARIHPIPVDSPPPPQRTVPETHYVAIEKDSFAKAHQWASEHVARKYPGATEVLQTQDSLIKQYLSAH